MQLLIDWTSNSRIMPTSWCIYVCSNNKTWITIVNLSVWLRGEQYIGCSTDLVVRIQVQSSQNVQISIHCKSRSQYRHRLKFEQGDLTHQCWQTLRQDVGDGQQSSHYSAGIEIAVLATGWRHLEVPSTSAKGLRGKMKCIGRQWRGSERRSLAD